MGKFIQMLLLVVAMAMQATSFAPGDSTNLLRHATRAADAHHHRMNALFMAGFGGGGGASKGKKKKEKKATPLKLKPKLQWDRYEALTKQAPDATRVMAGIRLIGEENAEWLSVGKVKSKDGKLVAAAVAMQRAIIAEHGKRLYPLKVSKKSTCEWGYTDVSSEGDDSSGGEWTPVDVKAVIADIPDGLEKEIGFEGIPDPATGFYCVYDNGKLKVGEETSFT